MCRRSSSLGRVDSVVQDFEDQRPRLFWLAYRLLGSASEAEDALGPQEAAEQRETVSIALLSRFTRV